MSEEKESKYKKQIEEIKDYIDKQKEKELSQTVWFTLFANLIKTNDLFFVGFYLVKDQNWLELGPYNSTILPTPLIEKGKGLCGSCWAQNQVRLENDVTTCNNYIACDLDTKSEIVIPVRKQGQVIAVLDIDCVHKNYFVQIDQFWLQKIVDQLETVIA